MPWISGCTRLGGSKRAPSLGRRRLKSCELESMEHILCHRVPCIGLHATRDARGEEAWRIDHLDCRGDAGQTVELRFVRLHAGSKPCHEAVPLWLNVINQQPLCGPGAGRGGALYVQAPDSHEGDATFPPLTTCRTFVSEVMRQLINDDFPELELPIITMGRPSFVARWKRSCANTPSRQFRETNPCV
jgi:hypothetical protein